MIPTQRYTDPTASCFIFKPHNRGATGGNETSSGGLKQEDKIGDYQHKFRIKCLAMVGGISKNVKR